MHSKISLGIVIEIEKAGTKLVHSHLDSGARQLKVQVLPPGSVQTAANVICQAFLYHGHQGCSWCQTQTGQRSWSRSCFLLSLLPPPHPGEESE